MLKLETGNDEWLHAKDKLELLPLVLLRDRGMGQWCLESLRVINSKGREVCSDLALSKITPSDALLNYKITQPWTTAE